MGTITVAQEGRVGAPADLTYRLIADDAHHQQFLPQGITNFEVVEGGVGAGTLHRFTVTAGRRARVPHARRRTARTRPHRDRSELIAGDDLHVAPAGDSCVVRIETQWNGAGGIGGFFERTFAPRVLRKMYADELARLDSYVSEQHKAAT